MGKLIGVLDKLVNFFTRRNERHNYALNETRGLVQDIEEFLTKYAPKDEKNDFGLISENIGKAQFELIAIEYKIRIKIKIAKKIRGKYITPLLQEVHSDVELVKRAILNPTLGNTMLVSRLTKLYESFENLNEVISYIEYR